MTSIIPLDIQNELHLKLMYEVRTHPDVDSMLCGTPPKDFEQHVHYLRNVTGKAFFIIATDQTLCGYCQMTLRENEVELGWALHPEWWGKKIGSASVKLLIEYVQRLLPIHQISLVVKKNNLPALHLYRKNGFIIHIYNELKNEYLMHLPKN